jgi:hypothetical protein
VNVTILNEWESAQESLRLSWWRISKENSSDHQNHDRLSDFVCVKEEWQKTTMCQLSTTQCDNSTRQLFSITDRRVARWLDKTQWFMSLNLKDVYYWVRMKEDEEWKMTFWTRYEHYEYMSCHLNSRMSHHLSKINQQHIERISQWLCDHISEWYIDIFRRSEDTLQTCVQDTWKAQERALYVKNQRADSKSESKVSRLCDSIWTHQEEFRKDCDSQKLININKDQESTSLSRIDELLLKVCIQLFENSRISHMIDTKTERWHWNKKQEEAFHTLKKSLSETAHLVISQSACKRY